MLVLFTASWPQWP